MDAGTSKQEHGQKFMLISATFLFPGVKLCVGVGEGFHLNNLSTDMKSIYRYHVYEKDLLP